MQEENEEEGNLNKELNKDLNKDLNPDLDKTINHENAEEELEEIKEEIEKKESRKEERKENEKEYEGKEERQNEKKEIEEKQKVEQKTGTKPEEKKDEKDYLAEEKKIEKLRQLVETVLFMSSKPIELKEIGKICETTDLTLISELIKALTRDLTERKSGIEITRETEGYRMQVLPELEVKVSHLAGPARFSKGVMKTMAYIAFKQPVKQSTIIKYRTNKAYDEIKILEEHGFISKEKAGITYVIKTTKKFLQYFGGDAIRLKKNPEFELQNKAEQ